MPDSFYTTTVFDAGTNAYSGGGSFADPFTTVADGVPNAGTGEAANPFDAPGPTDTSQWLAANDLQLVRNSDGLLVPPSFLNDSHPQVPPSDDIQWVTTSDGLQIPSELVPQVSSEDTGPKLGQPSPWTTVQVVTPSSSAPAPPANTSQLNSAIQEAVAAGGPYDPAPVTPPNISDVLAGSDWASFLEPQNSSPAPLSNSLVPLSNDQPGRITQILSGTYAESVLQTQLGNQGRVQGNFVSPFPPYEKLFNPNATTSWGHRYSLPTVRIRSYRKRNSCSWLQRLLQVSAPSRPG